MILKETGFYPGFVSERRTVSADEFLESAGDLAERAVLNCVEQFCEYIAISSHHSDELIESPLGLGSMTAFELLQAANLFFLFVPRGAHNGYGLRFFQGAAISIQTDQRPGALVDLRFVTIR